MNNFDELLIENPIIAAIRNDNELEKALESKAKVVFVLYGDIMKIEQICMRLKEKEKIIFIHLDMIEGLRGDFAGIQFIKNVAKPYGIITTKSANIKYAKQQDIFVIQRLFIIDSLSLKTGIRNIQDNLPNAVEVMPGIASKIISSIQSQVKVPIIAGGLIDCKKDIMDSLASGALAVSTTAEDLWNL